MKKHISPQILEFLKGLPTLTKKINKNALTEEDKDRLKVMLSTSNTPQAQADRKALIQYILNFEPENDIRITDADRKTIAAHLRKHAPAFYRLLQEKSS